MQSPAQPQTRAVGFHEKTRGELAVGVPSLLPHSPPSLSEVFFFLLSIVMCLDAYPARLRSMFFYFKNSPFSLCRSLPLGSALAVTSMLATVQRTTENKICACLCTHGVCRRRGDP